MPAHEFVAHLDRQPTDHELDALFEAGLDDVTPEVGHGRAMLHVNREARTLAEAILSVVHQVAAAGLSVAGIGDDDAVSLKTIAGRVGRSYESVRLLATGKRGPGGFPAALASDGFSLYSWTSVSDWFDTHYQLGATASEHARTIAAADHLLRARALLPDLTPLATLTQIDTA